MTRVAIHREENNCTVVAKDHATGSREVCAGVSALVTALQGWLHNDSHVTILHEHVAPGDVRLVWDGDIGSAWDMFLVGLLQIQHDYSDYLEVIFA